eukprot:GFYU01003515.1.p2 GENE.GFYU01003515.1~~GFYU01003515.1.p2  ORF type:complete len:499 (+),score=244.27 GFYU01003515.1:80-1498(+)
MMKKSYNELKHVADNKQSDLSGGTDKLKELETLGVKPTQDDTPLARQIRTLENRLDKAMIKYNEAQSIRKTYEQIVKRLKEERIGFDNQLGAIERTLKAKQHDYEELLLMSHDAQHAKEVAKAELAKFEQQVTEERKVREKELAERRQMVQAKVEMNQRMEQREKARRDIVLEAHGDLNEEGEKSLKKSMVTNVFQQNLNALRIEEEQEKITTYEEAFRKIKDATGVSDVNEVIQKFLTQEDTHHNLIAMTKEAQVKIDQYNDEKATLKQQVEEIKYAGTGTLGSRRIVDRFETHLADANAKCERNRQKHERIAKILIGVKSGVEHLADKLDCVKIDAPPVQMSDETVVDVLNQCELKLKMLLDVIKEEQMDDDAKDAKKQGFEPDMPQHNIRIKLPARDQQEDEEEEDAEEDAEEDVPDRDAMKKFANLMVEKATKKQKKKRRRVGGEKKGGDGASISGKGTKSMGTKELA